MKIDKLGKDFETLLAINNFKTKLLELVADVLEVNIKKQIYKFIIKIFLLKKNIIY